LAQGIHVTTDLVVGDLGVNLCGGDVFVSEHLADRLQGNTLREGDRGRKGVPCHMHRRIERQPGMACHMSQGHIHRITVFDREYFISGEPQSAVTFYKPFGHRQQLDPKLRSCLLSMVHDPQITPFIRVNIVMGEFLYIGIGKPREAAKYEYVPDDGCLVIGDIDPHHGLQFRFEKETSVAVGYVDVETDRR
jgi:hypothetical protein